MRSSPAVFCTVTGVVGAAALWLLRESAIEAVGFLALALFWAGIYVVVGERR